MIVRGILCLLASVPAAASAQPDPKQPTGRWTVSIVQNECHLIRTYGTPTDPLFLMLRKTPMEGGSDFTILYGSAETKVGHGEARISFNGEPSIQAQYGAMPLLNRSSDIRARILRSVTVGQDIERPDIMARDARTVAFVLSNEISAAFALPDQSAALKELDSCARRLGVEWGYSIEEQSRLKEPATHPGGFGRIFSGADYPPAAIRRNKMGRVTVRIGVDRMGAVSDCVVLKSSGSDDLDAATCAIIRARAKFNPAIDVDGNPVRSVQAGGISWILE